MIYLHGSAIEVTEARVVPVWFETIPDRIRWHYEAPKKPRGKVELQAVLMIRAKWKDDGKPIVNGKWRTFVGMGADGGFAEIDAKCAEVSPDVIDKYNRWLSGELQGEVTDHFERVADRDVG